MAVKAHVLVVDDEPDIRASIAEYLGVHDFDVSTADGGAAARRIIDGRKPVDLVILDVRMPGEDGISIARSLRQRGGIGILMLTAAGETVDRIVGYEVGADDYMVKPFDLRELLARVKSLLRRVGAAPVPNAAPDTHRVSFGRFVLDFDNRRLADGDGVDIALTAMEFDLIATFVRHPNQVLNRDRLIELSHGEASEPFDRSVDVRIVRLRRQIEVDPARPRFIKPVRGAGYVFSPEV
jgi:two-component system, OmpR family, phosphate regulon response regulator OmpR